MKIKGYQEDADGINLYFEDRQPVRGKLLVGADGALSQIRRQLFPDEKDPSLARVCWQGTATVDAVKGDTQGTKSHMWSDGLRWGGVLRIPGPDGSTMTSWMFVTQTNKDIEHQIERLMASSGPEARQKRLQMALDAMEDFDSDFKRVVRSTEQSKDQVRLACVYQRAPGMVWGKGRVTLLGDAAHLVSPMYGVGRAMCLEDGLALGSSIQRYGARELALRRYECMRIHRVTRVQVAMAGACHGKAFVAEDGKMEERKERMLKFILDYKPEPLLPQGNDLDRATVRDRVSIRGEGDPEKRTEAELSSVSPRCGKRCCHRVDSGYAMQEEATNHNIV